MRKQSPPLVRRWVVELQIKAGFSGVNLEQGFHDPKDRRTRKSSKNHSSIGLLPLSTPQSRFTPLKPAEKYHHSFQALNPQKVLTSSSTFNTETFYRNQSEVAQACRGTISLHGALIHTVDSCTFVISNGGTQTFHIKGNSFDPVFEIVRKFLKAFLPFSVKRSRATIVGDGVGAG